MVTTSHFTTLSFHSRVVRKFTVHVNHAIFALRISSAVVLATERALLAKCFHHHHASQQDYFHRFVCWYSAFEAGGTLASATNTSTVLVVGNRRNTTLFQFDERRTSRPASWSRCQPCVACCDNL
jgi:hypothetical protein